MHCTNCGAKLPEGAKFCAQCGTAVAQQASPTHRSGITVDQHVQMNEGQVVGLTAGQGALQDGLNANINQEFGTIKEGGSAVGAILGPQGPVHVGGQQTYGDVVHGPKTPVDTGGAAYVAGGVSVSGGDFVGHDMHVAGDMVRGDKIGGDKITVGDVTGDAIAIGRGAQGRG